MTNEENNSQKAIEIKFMELIYSVKKLAASQISLNNKVQYFIIDLY